MFRKAAFKRILVAGLSACLLATTCFTSCREEDNTAKWEIATTTADLKGSEGFETDEKTIRGLYDAGFRNIDLGMYGFGVGSVYMQENWREEVQSLKSVADELGMKFVQAHAQSGNPLSSQTEEVESLVEVTLRQIEICQELEIKNIVVHSGYRYDLTKETWFEGNKNFYELLLPTAQSCGVNILCENSTKRNVGDKYFINSGKDMLEFIQYVDHPNFHGCWDTGHANCETDDQYEDIVTLGEELYAIHYNDNYAVSDLHVMPYIGTLNNDRVLEALKTIKYKGYFTLECDGRSRAGTPWTGPKLSIFNELRPGEPIEDVPMTLNRFEQEKLLYATAEYLLSSHNMLKK